MTQATARREWKEGRAAGRCTCCGARGEPSTNFPHELDCKLVSEHSELRLKVKEAS